MHPKAHPLVLDGQTFYLLYDLGAMATLKRDHGINLFQIDDDDLMDPELLQAVLAVGLRKYHTDMTLERVGELVGPGELVNAVTAFSEAWAKALDQEVESDATDPPESRVSLGTGTQPPGSPTASSASPQPITMG